VKQKLHGEKKIDMVTKKSNTVKKNTFKQIDLNATQ